MPFESIAILGPGLIGGSLVLALQARPNLKVRVWGRRQAAIDQLKKAGVVAYSTTDIGQAAKGADLVVLATPMEVMGDLGIQMLDHLGSETIEKTLVTDVGSAKGPVVEEMCGVFKDSPYHFIGSHPMAGSEQAGFCAAREDLFEGAACGLTPREEDPKELVDKVASFWKDLGCRIERMSPSEHDRRIAMVSHLPHVAASLLVMASVAKDRGSAAVAGSGFRDSTRIAAGDADLWLGILQQNRSEVVSALKVYQGEVAGLLAILEGMDDGAVRNFLAKAASIRKEMFSQPSSTS